MDLTQKDIEQGYWYYRPDEGFPPKSITFPSEYDDGTIHCDKSPGMTLDRIGQELSSAGIKVFSSRKGYDGREGIALCGTPTGQINIYEIASSDVFEALLLGFKQLPENSIRKEK